MKIKHIWSVLCKESVIDQTDNNISIHGVLEQLAVNLAPMNGIVKLPESLSIPLNYEIVSMWQRSRDVDSITAEIAYTLIDPNNKKLLKNIQKIEIPKTSRTHRSRMKITGLPLSKEGDYTFQVEVKEEGTDNFTLVSELPLEVKINLEKIPVKA